MQGNHARRTEALPEQLLHSIGQLGHGVLMAPQLSVARGIASDRHKAVVAEELDVELAVDAGSASHATNPVALVGVVLLARQISGVEGTQAGARR